MPKFNKRGKGGPRKPSLAALSSFASAKASTYDKQGRKRKERALNSKVVNKYRKLKARLSATGAAVPLSSTAQGQHDDTTAGAQPARQRNPSANPQHPQQADGSQKQRDGFPAGKAVQKFVCILTVHDATIAQSAPHHVLQGSNPSLLGNPSRSCSALRRRRRPSGYVLCSMVSQHKGV
jgi:hypothetical protein